MRRLAAILALGSLAACTTPLGSPIEETVAPEPRPAPEGPTRPVPREQTITGTAGIEYTNARIRTELVDPECARRGLAFAALSIGRLEGGSRPYTATCA